MAEHGRFRDLRRTHPLARYLNDPKLPAPLSEALTAEVIRDVYGHGVEVVSGGRLADLIALLPDHGELLVEAKGTGANRRGFTYLGTLDIREDLAALVWVSFADTLTNPALPIVARVILRPGTLGLRRGRQFFERIIASAPADQVLTYHVRLADGRIRTHRVS